MCSTPGIAAAIQPASVTALQPRFGVAMSECLMETAGMYVDQERTAAATTDLREAVGIVIGVMGAEQASAAEGAAAAVAAALLTVALTAVAVGVAACAVRQPQAHSHFVPAQACSGTEQHLEPYILHNSKVKASCTHVLVHTRQCASQILSSSQYADSGAVNFIDSRCLPIYTMVKLLTAALGDPPGAPNLSLAKSEMTPIAMSMRLAPARLQRLAGGSAQAPGDGTWLPLQFQTQ